MMQQVLEIHALKAVTVGIYRRRKRRCAVTCASRLHSEQYTDTAKPQKQQPTHAALHEDNIVYLHVLVAKR